MVQRPNSEVSIVLADAHSENLEKTASFEIGATTDNGLNKDTVNTSFEA